MVYRPVSKSILTLILPHLISSAHPTGDKLILPPSEKKLPFSFEAQNAPTLKPCTSGTDMRIWPKCRRYLVYCLWNRSLIRLSVHEIYGFKVGAFFAPKETVHFFSDGGIHYYVSQNEGVVRHRCFHISLFTNVDLIKQFFAVHFFDSLVQSGINWVQYFGKLFSAVKNRYSM